MPISSYVELMAGAEFDEPEPQPIHHRLLILATPRVGSNLLCDLLWQAGCGVGLEYFSRDNQARTWLSERWGVTSASEYVEALERYRTRGGVFAVKSMPFDLATRAAESYMSMRFPEPFTHTVVLTRADVEAQVMSNARAAMTRRFVSLNGNPPKHVDPPDPVVDHFWGIVKMFNRQLLRIAAAVPTPKLFLEYEHLDSDRERVLTDVFRFLELDPPDVWPTPRLVKMRPSGDG